MSSVTDFTQYAALRADARKSEESALREVAEQFEALFVQQMLKSMREASFGDPFFPDTGAHQVYRDLLDQQLAADSAARGGIGLADMIVQQMQPRAPVAPVALRPSTPATPAWSTPADFVRDVLPHARAAAAELNVSPLAVLSQAALETGWGQKMPTEADTRSWNLFGIKATGQWRGPSVSQSTLEFREGVASRERADFRAYPSLDATFRDYVGLLRDGARYRDVPGAGDNIAAFANALQSAGYATDPDYARKLERIAGSETMRATLATLKQNDLLSLSNRQAGVDPAHHR